MFPGDPPQMAPLTLGARLRIALEVLGVTLLLVICTDFYRFFRFVVPEYSHMTISLYDHCFFFRIRPPEESLHQKCGARRGEFDSSTLEVSRGF